MIQQDEPVNSPPAEGAGVTNSDQQEFKDYAPTDQVSQQNAADALDYSVRNDHEEEPRIAIEMLEDYGEHVKLAEMISRLHTSSSPDEARDTSNILRQRDWLLDGSMKGVSLRGADLRSVDFSAALLVDANLDECNLSFADLSDADLENASLREANFEGAVLEGVNFAGADLTNANLKMANCAAADFHDAEVTMEQLAQAARLEDAILPDGTQWDKEP